MVEINLGVIITLINIVFYIVVFRFQKTNIDGLKSMNESMKNYASTFDLKQVNDYVEMNNITNNLNLKNTLQNSDEFKKVIEESRKDLREELLLEMIKKFDGKNQEIHFAMTDLLKEMDKTKRELFLNQKLKLNRDYFKELL